jgi:hypothetical protein
MQYKYINYYLKCCLYHYRTSAAALAAEARAKAREMKEMKDAKAAEKAAEKAAAKAPKTTKTTKTTTKTTKKPESSDSDSDATVKSGLSSLTATEDEEEPVPEGDSVPAPPAHKARKVAGEPGVKVKPTKAKAKAKQTPGDEGTSEGMKGKSPKSPFITNLPIIVKESDSLPLWARSHPCLWDRKHINFKIPAKKTAIRNEKAAALCKKHPTLPPITGKF